MKIKNAMHIWQKVLTYLTKCLFSYSQDEPLHRMSIHILVHMQKSKELVNNSQKR